MHVPMRRNRDASRKDAERERTGVPQRQGREDSRFSTSRSKLRTSASLFLGPTHPTPVLQGSWERELRDELRGGEKERFTAARSLVSSPDTCALPAALLCKSAESVRVGYSRTLRKYADRLRRTFADHPRAHIPAITRARCTCPCSWTRMTYLSADARARYVSIVGRPSKTKSGGQKERRGLLLIRA